MCISECTHPFLGGGRRGQAIPRASCVRNPWVRQPRGFSLIELLVALMLTSLLALALLPLWHGMRSGGVAGGDGLIAALQGRVASLRFERDLRLADSGVMAELGCAPILEATPHQVVLLSRSTGGGTGGLEVVEWEFTSGSLMRRRAPYTGYLPAAFAHSFFRDHKTMLEEVAEECAFEYYAGESRLDLPLSRDETWRIDSVRLSGYVVREVGNHRVRAPLAAWGKVGR